MRSFPEEESLQSSVLIIEDEAGPRIALKVLLEPFYKLHFAGNADDAFAFLHQRPVNLIIQDMHLPGRSQGLSLLEELRRKFPDIPVLILTGYLTTSAANCEQVGAAAYLLKPFGIDELVKTVQQLVQEKPRTMGHAS